MATLTSLGSSMTAEGKPPTKESLLAPMLRAVARLATRWPKPIVLGALAATAVCIAVSVNGLGFRTSRLDLLNPESAYNQRWLAYLAEFGNDDDVVVVVEGANASVITPAITELARRVDKEPDLFFDLFCQQNFDLLRRKALHLASEDSLRRLSFQLDEVQPVLAGQWHQLNAAAILERASRRLASKPDLNSSNVADMTSSLRDLQSVIESLSAALAPTPSFRPPWQGFDELDASLPKDNSEFLLTDDGTMGFLLLKIRNEGSQFVGPTDALDCLREITRDVAQQHPQTNIGLTGMPVLECDEMRASQSDMTRASVFSLLGVAALFMAGFGGWRHPLMCVVALLMAMAWSFAYATLGIGHLNILSVSFGVILIGLGIDFGIHFIAGYLHQREGNANCRTAIIRTAGGIGPGIVTGAVTTAIAFFMAALTQFTGVAELGVIAGGGILLCVIAALVILPALIQWIDGGGATRGLPRILPIGDLFEPLSRYPKFALAVGLLPVLLMSIGIAFLRFDHNLLNLQPKQLESVRLEHKLIEQADRSVWFALSVARDQDEVKRRKQQFEALETVEHVEEIATLLPEHDAARSQAIARIQARLADLPSEPPVIPGPSTNRLRSTVEQLRNQLSQFEQQARVQSAPATEASVDIANLQVAISALANTLAQSTPDAIGRRLAWFQQQSAQDLLTRLHDLHAASDPNPPKLADLPPGLASRFVGKNGRHLLRVYARGNVWDMDRLSRFVADVERVDPRITGHPVQTFYASRQMQQSYIHAAIYSLLAVAIVLMLDFRSISATLLSMLPVALGMVQLFGLLGIMGIPLNPANLIVLPLILGIGIDDGVHVVHDFRRQSGRFRLGNSTATAIVITSATTMIGFGCMMIAQHQGIRSLGQVLTLGVFCCLVTSLVVLPAVLTLISSRREASETNELASAPASVETPPNVQRPAAAAMTVAASASVTPRRVCRE